MLMPHHVETFQECRSMDVRESEFVKEDIPKLYYVEWMTKGHKKLNLMVSS